MERSVIKEFRLCARDQSISVAKYYLYENGRELARALSSHLMNIDFALNGDPFRSPRKELPDASRYRGEISVPSDRVMGQAHRLSRK